MGLIRVGDLQGVPAHGSFSQLTSLADCELKYRLERSKIIPETPAWFFFGGTAMHSAIEEWERLRFAFGPGHVGPSTLKGLYGKHLEAGIAEAEKVQPDRSKWRAAKGGKEGEEFWRRHPPFWCEAYAAQAGLWRPMPSETNHPAVEVKFDLELGGVTVQGYIDQILIGPDGELRIRDLKFGSSDGNPLQLGLYRVAASECFGLEVQLGDFWNPRKKQQAPPVNVRKYTRKFYDYFFARLEERRQLDPLPHVGRDCGWCDFRQVCPAWPDNEAEAFEL